MGLRQDSILIARNLGPAELLEYDRRRLKGVILEEGSLTAHVTIVARAMGVPVLGRVRDVRQMIAEGDMLLLDTGEECVRPPDAGDAGSVRGQARAQPEAPRRLCPDAQRRAGDGRRPPRHGDGQCRSARRSRRARPDRRRRHRPVPHRVPVPRLGHLAPARGAEAALQGRARSRGGSAGDLPHRRHRRRQGAALSQP
jgi:phosphohistidine swiveling domain-containing protein